MALLSFAVSQAGLEIPVLVGLDGPKTAALHAAGQAIAPPLLVRGLLDTGSSVTGVAPWILRRLGHGSGSVAISQTASGIVKVFVHHVSISIVDANQASVPSFTLPTVMVSELPAALPDADVLVGLDVLLECKLALDGPRRQFQIDF